MGLNRHFHDFTTYSSLEVDNATEERIVHLISNITS